MQLNKTFLSLSILFLLTACGGGSGTSDSQQSHVPPSQPIIVPPTDEIILPKEPETTPSVQEQLINTVNIEDIATELTAAHFALESWTPRAMSIDNSILYIADSYPTPQILRYDLKNNKVLTKLTLSGLANSWTDLTDVHVSGNRMYVTNGVQQRADIFELKGDQANFIMSLGTGQNQADQTTLGLTYPTGVISNQNYVFVADQQNQISVWLQDQIKNSNDRQAQKHARLSLPNCTKGCMVRMTLVDDYLYAATTQGDTFVYALKDVAQAHSQRLIEPTKTQSNAATAFYLSPTDKLLYASQPTGRIQMFKQENVLNAANILPEVQFDAVSQYRLAQQSAKRLGKALDIQTHQDLILSLFDKTIAVLPVRRLQHQRQDQQAKPIRLLESTALEHTRMLQEGESWSVLTNQNERSVHMNQILSASFERDRIRVKSYSAVPVSNLQIKAKLRRTEQWVILAELDQLTPFSSSSIPFELNDQTLFNLEDGSGAVRLDGVDRFVELPANLFEEIRIDSATDTHVQKLNQIKAKWKIYFGTYDEPGKWCRITPVYAREWVIMMTNLAYILSSPEFETLWFNHKAVMGYDFFGTAGKVNAPNGFYSAEEYQNAYQRILNRSNVRLGVTNMGGGLGGEEVLGVDTWLFYGHYRLSGFRIIAHEFGHAFGGHNTAWASVYEGFEAMVDELNFYFQRRPGSLPYMDPNVNAFHLTPDSQLCQGVNQNMVNSVAKNAPWNKVDEYFKKNPMP